MYGGSHLTAPAPNSSSPSPTDASTPPLGVVWTSGPGVDGGLSVDDDDAARPRSSCDRFTGETAGSMPAMAGPDEAEASRDVDVAPPPEPVLARRRAGEGRDARCQNCTISAALPSHVIWYV